jgi:hypothetical protein
MEEDMAQDFLRCGVKGMPVAWMPEPKTDEIGHTNDYVAGPRDRHPDAFLTAWVQLTHGEARWHCRRQKGLSRS